MLKIHSFVSTLNHPKLASETTLCWKLFSSNYFSFDFSVDAEKRNVFYFKLNTTRQTIAFGNIFVRTHFTSLKTCEWFRFFFSQVFCVFILLVSRLKTARRVRNNNKPNEIVFVSVTVFFLRRWKHLRQLNQHSIGETPIDDASVFLFSRTTLNKHASDFALQQRWTWFKHKIHTSVPFSTDLVGFRRNRLNKFLWMWSRFVGKFDRSTWGSHASRIQCSCVGCVFAQSSYKQNTN